MLGEGQAGHQEEFLHGNPCQALGLLRFGVPPLEVSREGHSGEDQAQIGLDAFPTEMTREKETEREKPTARE